ncbi:hypothetical protein HID58_049086, partial [Brassica napus]
MKMQETEHESDPETKSTFKADINQFGSCEKDSDCDKKCFPSCQLTKCSIRHTCECIVSFSATAASHFTAKRLHLFSGFQLHET